MTDAPFPCFMCKSAGTCDRCLRLKAIGQLALCAAYMLAGMIQAVWDEPDKPGPEDNILDNTHIDDAWEVYMRNLDAIGLLLVDRGKLVRAHRKELNEEIREGQRAARDSYAEGRFEGERGRDDGW